MAGARRSCRVAHISARGRRQFSRVLGVGPFRADTVFQPRVVGRRVTRIRQPGHCRRTTTQRSLSHRYGKELTCHIESHSVTTCHPAEVTFSPLGLPPAKLVLDLSTSARRQSSIQVLTGPVCVNFVHATNAANHYATPPTSEG